MINNKIWRIFNLNKYYFKVIAKNNNGFGPESNIFTETPIKKVTNTPSKIETISIIPGNTFIDLSWNTPYNGGIDITNYLIQKSSDTSNWVDLSSTTTSFRASNLSNDTKYYFKVRARNNVGLGTESNIFIEIPKIVDDIFESNE